MILVKAEITAFGKWRQKTFFFSEKNQIIFGNNEAGKSTLYQFIQAVLFGFPSKGKKKKDYTPKDGAAFGGKLWIQHPIHGEFMVERHRQQNRGKAKVYLHDQVGDDRMLETLIAPLSKALFQQVFTFQQEQLSDLEGLNEKELHDSLITLGITGSSAVFQKRQAYHQQAQLLYKKKGQKLPLNLAFQEWDQLQKKIKEKQKQEAIFSKLIVEEQQTGKSIERVKQEIEHIDEDLTKLRQMDLNFSLYEEWESLKKEQPFEIASDETIQQLTSFYEQYQRSAERIDELEKELEKHSGMDQQSAKYYFFLENEHELKDLLKNEVEITRLLDEYARLVNQKSVYLIERQTFEKRWGWDKSQLPKPFKMDDKWQEIVKQKGIVDEQVQQESIRLELNQEQYKQVETEINEIEKNAPFLADSSKTDSKSSSQQWITKTTLLLTALGALLLFLPGAFKFVGLLVLIGSIGYSLSKKQKSTAVSDQTIKEKWQEKLVRLDLAAESVATTEQQLKEINARLIEIEQSVKKMSMEYSLGTMNQFDLLEEFSNDVDQYVEIISSMDQIEQRAKEIERMLAKFEQKFVILSDWLPLEGKNINEKMVLLSAFVKEMDQLKFARSYQQNTLLNQQINHEKTKQKQLLDESQPDFLTVGLTYPSEVPLFLQKIAQLKKKQDRLNELTTLLKPVFPKKVTKNELQKNQQQLVSKKNELILKQDQFIETRQRYQLQLEHLRKDGTLDELYQEASLQQEKMKKLMVEWGALEVSSALLGDLSTELSERQLPQLLVDTSKYLDLLTNGRYKEIRLDGNILYAGNGHEYFSIYDLSTGTRDQVIMAIRFAYLSLESDRAICPIIIDDGWLHYDQGRKYQLAKLLAQFGRKYQIICFSSDQEMVSYYQELNQPVIQLEGEDYEENSRASGR